MSKVNIEMMRHSCAHLVAAAVQELYPDAKFGIGPTVENGFYYDIDFSKPIGEADLAKIEARAKGLMKKGVKFECEEMKLDEAVKFFKKIGQDYKVELLKDLKKKGTTKVKEKEEEEMKDLAGSLDKVTIYRTGEFVDLCRGPHLESVQEIGAFKLTKLAGAYWRGKSDNPQLQRIYGVCFESQAELDEYLKMLAEAEKRDHRKLGKELELFSFHDEGPGFAFFKPKGMIIWNELLNYWHKTHVQAGYDEVKTPIMLNRKLWETSGHWENYRENMYETKIDEMEYAIKPMNCPGGMLVYKEEIHSYRELPLRWGEIGLVHRHELSGTLSGLFRVRCFHQDDAHIFMRTDQIKEEIIGVIRLAEEIYTKFGLTYRLELSTRPKKSIGTDEAWELATAGLKGALDEFGKEYKINEGDGAFYGPKIDFHIQDAIGRTWQCGTIQLDMNLPERFNLTYVDDSGQEKRPVMIHRVIYGSMERFFGILIEHYAGAFPVWLSPVQVMLIPVSEKHAVGAEKINKNMLNAGIRVEMDAANETLGNRVRKAVAKKIPYIVVVGDKELAGEDWMIRIRGQEKQEKISQSDFTDRVLEEIKERK
ncbi:MAG: threonine--tRNA ligase [Candidatus Magasanikbacteria bacterium CG10_big_fil_rev_8_21_14_0_10_36_32]|uniref:Threonine--tRNA ligase n=1 Tax=Candidatus Magasanikbacteria bacterium CG10_big_fil_rev_8_21_14_0_10_36_32 TaxID=1974646 RepID=A0A2M6W6M9_9BACT|nr:MAG: threonine--tRNA ligase [Candidatus Magasanikbacteria bacterium CG10_big_fil_rev_8_21_14_0_10_36_32]